MDFPFEILVNDQLMQEFIPSCKLTPISNKKVLSIVNDFEDCKWRNDIFRRFIWNNIIEDALNKEERDSLIKEPDSMLEKAASRLRILTYKSGKDEDTGGEIAEICLYGIMRNYYHALPIVPKIFYKQNKNDYVKGADSVHIVIEGDDDFSLWLGEAKFYKNIENTDLEKVVKSVNDTISTEKIKKENSIITGLSDLDRFNEIHTKLKSKIKDLLNQDVSIDKIKPKLHIPIFLLHECSITASATELTDDYRAKIIDFHKDRAKAYFSKQIAKCNGLSKYSEIKFHLILFPVPNKDNIVDKFINRAKELRDNG